jgi:hypothetical protein
MGFIIMLWLLLMINRGILSDLFMEKDAEQLLKMTDGPSISKFMNQRLLQSLSLVLLVVLSIYLQGSLLHVLIWIVVAVLVYKLPYIRLKGKFRSKVQQLKYEFPIWLRQLQILLQNNTVVVSLEKSTNLAPQLIQSHLEDFIIQLKSNPQDLMSYMYFLKSYECIEIERAMKLLFRYNTVGKEDSMRQLNRMIQTTAKWLREQRLDVQSSKNQMKQWWGMLPLFGVTIVFITMMIQTFKTLMERG